MISLISFMVTSCFAVVLNAQTSSDHWWFVHLDGNQLGRFDPSISQLFDEVATSPTPIKQACFIPQSNQDTVLVFDTIDKKAVQIDHFHNIQPPQLLKSGKFQYIDYATAIKDLDRTQQSQLHSIATRNESSICIPQTNPRLVQTSMYQINFISINQLTSKAVQLKHSQCVQDEKYLAFYTNIEFNNNPRIVCATKDPTKHQTNQTTKNIGYVNTGNTVRITNHSQNGLNNINEFNVQFVSDGTSYETQLQQELTKFFYQNIKNYALYDNFDNPNFFWYGNGIIQNPRSQVNFGNPFLYAQVPTKYSHRLDWVINYAGGNGKILVMKTAGKQISATNDVIFAAVGASCHGCTADKVYARIGYFGSRIPNDTRNDATTNGFLTDNPGRQEYPDAWIFTPAAQKKYNVQIDTIFNLQQVTSLSASIANIHLPHLSLVDTKFPGWKCFGKVSKSKDKHQLLVDMNGIFNQLSLHYDNSIIKDTLVEWVDSVHATSSGTTCTQNNDTYTAAVVQQLKDDNAQCQTDIRKLKQELFDQNMTINTQQVTIGQLTQQLNAGNARKGTNKRK